jgi:hypothetical protein
LSGRARLLAIVGAVAGVLLLLVVAALLFFFPLRTETGVEEETVTAQDVLERAAERMETVSSFRFALEHENGRGELLQGIEMERASGAYVSPDRVEAEVLGRAGPINVRVSFVLLPDESWMTNPLTGRWERTDATPEVLTELVKEMPALMRAAQDPAIVGIERLDGVEVYVVEGRLDSADLAFLVPGAPAGRPLRATAWIGREDPLVHRIEVAGPVTEREPELILRRLRLTDIGADIAIEPPR